jgi:hypothetical protein
MFRDSQKHPDESRPRMSSVDLTEICRALFAGGCVAILLAVFSEVIYEWE